ncbi:MAG: peptidylprolyl isomerase [Ignavibacteriaceae bacterium]|nr:peptidylprolyl isomerase [Ignavibacteriaceae bacterium]
MKKLLIIIPFLTTLVLGCNLNRQGKSMSDSTISPDSIIVAQINTNMGTIECELLPQVAPKASDNFIGLAKKGYYNGLTFHRVIENFMIQGGDPNGNGTGGQSVWGDFFDDEFNESIKFDSAGVLAMANRGPNTNGSQFFITLAATPWLNYHHTIFGKVIAGMDVLKEIGKVKTTKPYDMPEVKVVIDSVTVVHRAKNK